IGSDEQEAKLHGVLELVERDALGICFAKHIFKKTPDPVRQVDMESLPYSIKRLARDVGSTSNAELTIWDITTDIDVACILCSLRCRNGRNFQFFGSGASLSRGYAVQRAILEALQGFHLQFEFGRKLQSELKPKPRMTRRQMCDLDAGYFCYQGAEKLITYDQIVQPGFVNGKSSVQQQLTRLVQHLASKGYHVYCRTIYNDRLCVVQSVAPKLERFYLLQHGVLVGPGNRAREARN
ncbi:MAG: YcaO-like family protein, partial [Phycisphaerales bacterium]|nr:YcaO-like family protein [Phycisphaerales bacterium]